MIKKIVKRLLSFFIKPKDYPVRKGSNKKYIFIHINKTGGTSIAQNAGLPIKRHLTVKEVISIVGKQKFDSAYTFAVVRNPWSKVVSHYKFRVMKNHSKMKERPISFDDWVACTFGDNKDPFYYANKKMFMPQVDWLKDEGGNITLNRIIRFENLQSEFEVIANEIGINSDLPHLNQTPKDDYKTYYTNDVTKGIITDWYKEDIDTFGYRF